MKSPVAIIGSAPTFSALSNAAWNLHLKEISTTPPPSSSKSTISPLSSLNDDGIGESDDMNNISEQQQQLQLPPPPQVHVRTEVLRLGSLVGDMCSKFISLAPMDSELSSVETTTKMDTSSSLEEERTTTTPPSSNDNKNLSGSTFWSSESTERNQISLSMASIFLSLLVLAKACGLDLQVCILKKMELNRKKYPVELCKGKSGSYTQYSSITGITKTEGQSTLNTELNANVDIDATASSSTLDDMTLVVRTFATERDWSRFHTPRNILLAMMGELGELAEHFQWKGDGTLSGEGNALHLEGWDEHKVDSVGQELADVGIYLLRLADVCGVALATTTNAEIERRIGLLLSR